MGVAGRVDKRDVAASASVLVEKAHEVRRMAVRGDLTRVSVAATGVAEELEILFKYLLDLDRRGEK